MTYREAMEIKKLGIDFAKISKDIVYQITMELAQNTNVEFGTERLIELVTEQTDKIEIDKILSVCKILFKSPDLNVDSEEDYEAIEEQIMNFKLYLSEQVAKTSKEFIDKLNDTNFQNLLKQS